MRSTAAGLLDSVRVTLGKDATGSHAQAQALRELATVGVRGGALYVHCFDASYVRDVEKALYAAAFAPQAVPGDEEGMLRVPIPR